MACTAAGGGRMKLDGLKVLITGGGRGIGREIARALSERGAALVLVGRDVQGLERAASALPGPVTTVPCDLSDVGAVDSLIERVRADHRDLGGLVNNAAVQHEIDLVHGDPADTIDRARGEIALNLAAPVALALGLLPLLRVQRQALVVNVTTGLAYAPKEASPVYCASKAGLHAFTQALRYQCERQAPNLLVTEAILPLVDTDMTRGRGGIGGRGGMAPVDVARAIVRGLEKDRVEVWVGQAKLLRVLRRIAPGVPARILRGNGHAAHHGGRSVRPSDEPQP